MGQLRVSRTQVPVADLAREAIELVRPALEQAGVGIVVDAPAGLEVLADRERMRQVIVNLVSNALRFSDRGAVIRLGVCEDGDRVQFTLTDEGPGIPAADRERVFEAFWHGEGSQSTGLGLAIAKRIMDVHGERIWAESSPSGGAALVFTLPRARPERSASDR
jgi:signal transduction histidine kinase